MPNKRSLKPETKTKKPAKKPVKLDKNAKSYRDRAKQEQRRYADSVDARIWTALTFPTMEDLQTAREQLGLPGNHEMIWFEDLQWDDYELERPRKHMGRPIPFRGALPAHPLMDYWESEEGANADLETSSRRELEILLEALESATSHPTERRASNIWVAVVFDNNRVREDWLERFGLRRLGDNYIEGPVTLRILLNNQKMKQ